jgi:hypothetical protein
MIPDSNDWITVSKIMDSTNFISSESIEDDINHSYSIEAPITQKIMFDRLSNEAKEVIKLIFYAPNEMLEIWSAKDQVREQTITRRKFRRYVRTIFTNKKDRRRIVQEIEGYVRSIT